MRCADDRISELLSTPSGLELYWRELGAECSRSSMIFLLEKALKLDGDVVECGVFRGASFRRICKSVRDLAPAKTVYGLDSFSGFLGDDIGEHDVTRFRPKDRLAGKFTFAGDVPERLEEFGTAYAIKIRLLKGYFNETLSCIPAGDLCFIHLDSDTYRSHLECLAALYDRLVDGGTIVYDDYKAPAWPGATKAIEEFLITKCNDVRLCEVRKQAAWYSTIQR